MKIIEVRNLGKRYRKNDFYSLKAANFVIEEGDIVGLVGKNGSGKSTLLKLLAKSQHPTEGEVFFKDKNIFKEDNILNDFGIMIDPVYFPQISVEENLELFLKIHQKEEFLPNIESTLRLVGLWDARTRKPVDFSFGMKQRTALALALVTKPKFVLLDEPFVGLDPIGVKNLLTILKDWAKTNKTSMIVSSHQLAELEDLCNRYLFIDQGVIQSQFEAEQKSIVIELNKVSERREDSDSIIDKLVSEYGLFRYENKVEITDVEDNRVLNEILEQLAASQSIKTILSKKESLERLFSED